jgi:hypothetical protein
MRSVFFVSLCGLLLASFDLYANPSQTIAVSKLLDAQGRIVNHEHRSGSVDFSGYTPIIDPLAGLRFVPAPPLAPGWNALGSGLNNQVVAIAISGSEMYVGGTFEDAGGNTNADYIARWDGNSWNALGSGLNSSVFAIAISSSDVYVGGQFTDAGGNANADFIARWNGSAWNALGTGLNDAVFAIAISGSDVYVGGDFLDVGGNYNADFIARWNGTSWNVLGTGLNDRVHTIAISGSDVYVGGGFMDAGGNTNADYIARWDGSSWNALGSGLNSFVNAIAISGNDVYVGGPFTDAGSNANADCIARWDGSNWNALGSGLNSYVLAIAISGSDVYVGGVFTDAGGNANADRIARWDGTSWNALGTGLNNQVLTIAISGSEVYVGGGFTDAGGIAEADYIARWENVALPVVWVSVRAKQQAQAVLVEWSVATQHNNAGWHIEHSTDGINWVRIGWVAGDGDERELKNYAFLHDTPAKGQNYYRLLQTDYDSRAEYSKIVTVEVQQHEGGIRIFPNPARENLVLDIEKLQEGDNFFYLHDVTGKVVKSKALQGEAGAYRTDISLEGLPAGLYFVRVINGGQEWLQRLFVECAF